MISDQVCEIDDALRGIKQAWGATSASLHSTQARLTTAAIQATEELHSLVSPTLTLTPTLNGNPIPPSSLPFRTLIPTQDRSRATMVERIQLLCEQLRQEVNQREEVLLHELSMRVEGRREELEEGLSHNEVILERLACCIANGGRILQSKGPGCRLHCKDFIFSEARKLLADEKQSLVGVDRVVFDLDTQGHEEILDQISDSFAVQTTNVDAEARDLEARSASPPPLTQAEIVDMVATTES